MRKRFDVRYERFDHRGAASVPRLAVFARGAALPAAAHDYQIFNSNGVNIAYTDTARARR
jgi:hypothetical protein